MSEDLIVKRRKCFLFALLLLTLLLIAVFFSINSGAVYVSPSEIWQALKGGEASTHSMHIVRILRVPRTIVTMLVGANLALAGCILQGILRNPLADPGIIGVSAGAGLFAMILMVIFPAYTMFIPIAAFLGAVLSTAVVFSLAWEKGIHPLRMILAGVAIAAFFGGGMSIISVFFSERVQGTVMWFAGGFQGRSWSHVRMILPYSIVGIGGAFLFADKLNALQLGDDMAKSLGIKVMRTRTLLLIVSAFLAASSVSVAGMLGFVGLIVPHIMRLIVGADHEILLPCSALGGAFLVTAADTAARTLFSPLEIPVGIFMSFLGAPFFLYLLKKKMLRS